MSPSLSKSPSSPPSSRSANAAPKRLGRYEVCGRIAHGGMATVYLGRLRGAHGFERQVALKTLKGEWATSRDCIDMFVDEANIVAKLSHPNVVQIYELGDDGGQLFIAMELLLGRSLAAIWDECRSRGVRLRADLVAWIGARVAEGLHAAHELCDANGKYLELVHRDVSPSNILVTYAGQPKIIDFGLVKALDRVAKSQPGIVKGKLGYMSPEQTLAKPTDRRTDIFSLGATLWELSTDRRLFKGESAHDTVERIREAAVPDPTRFISEYPSLLYLVLKRALARDPKERYATAAELARDLDGVARAQGSIVQAATLGEVMQELFETELAREAAWFAEAVASDSPAPRPALHAMGGVRASQRPPGGAPALTSPFFVRTEPPPLPQIVTTQEIEPVRVERRWLIVLLGAAATIFFLVAAALGALLLAPK